MSQIFEEKINALIEQRKKLNTSDSFEEILSTWEEIKINYESCQETIKNISKQLEEIQNINLDETQSLENIKFEEAFNEIKNLSESIKTSSISEFPHLISRMQLLKSFCINKLEQEKLKIEEIK